MQLKVFRKGFNFSQDGPGNRLVYHLQGCNMHCGWCSNPEGMSLNGTLLVNPEHLNDAACPHGAITHHEIDRDRCATCTTKECLTRNRNQSIRFSSVDYDVDAIVSEAKRSLPLFYDGGGVTLSGGEATVQFAAVRQLLQRLKDEGIDTTVETNGSHPRLDELLPLIDHLIVDFKHHDDQKLKAVTGVGNRVIKRNLEKALATHEDLLIRIPLIGGINDAAADAEKFAAFFRQFDTRNTRFEFLTYHEFGKDKWAKIGMSYGVENGFVDEETPTLFRTIFETNHLNVTHT